MLLVIKHDFQLVGIAIKEENFHTFGQYNSKVTYSYNNLDDLIHLIIRGNLMNLSKIVNTSYLHTQMCV